jgi:hypothetical protein
MKHAFSIYPALLVLIPVKVQETIPPANRMDETEWGTEPDQYFTSCPQTYWGTCLFNGDKVQLMYVTNEDKKVCPVQSMLGGRLNALEPTKFKGQQYTITYIPVLN